MTITLYIAFFKSEKNENLAQIQAAENPEDDEE
jgi:hypothetical protein